MLPYSCECWNFSTFVLCLLDYEAESSRKTNLMSSDNLTLLKKTQDKNGQQKEQVIELRHIDNTVS